MAFEILTNAQMREADKAAIDGGIPSYVLMQNAGQAVCDAITSRVAPCSVLVLCGPGNNGGDGYVVAQKLLAEGWDVQVLALQPPATADAQHASSDYTGARLAQFEPRTLVVDALYGTGLERPIEGAEAELIRQVNDSPALVVAVDIASGISGDSGAMLGAAIRADITVALCRKKLGHVLMPGKMFSGEVVIADIGIDHEQVKAVGSKIWENAPPLWLDMFPFHRMDQHKYMRGHALIVGGDIAHTGASRLAARAALRIGAGLVSINCSAIALQVYAATVMAVMCKVTNSIEEFGSLIADTRITALAVGPGNGVNAETKQKALAALQARKMLVLDADGLSVFADNPQELFSHIESNCILTPHEGEFERLFAQSGIDMKKSRLERAAAAAALAKAIVLLKGPDTIIAAPDGSMVVNTNAPPTLATAGSGDVLTGIIAGLLAAGTPPFRAACAGAWMHGAAAAQYGDGLIAEDIPDMLPKVIAQLHNL